MEGVVISFSWAWRRHYRTEGMTPIKRRIINAATTSPPAFLLLLFLLRQCELADKDSLYKDSFNENN
jgi:hypothetical protein